MSDDKQEEKSGADKLNEAARPTVQEMMNIKEVDSSQIGQLKPVLDEERKRESPVIDRSHEGAGEAAQDAGLQEVGLSESGQLRPEDTPPGAKDEVTDQPEPDLAVSQGVESLEKSSQILAQNVELYVFSSLIQEGEKQVDSKSENAVQAHQDQAESERKNRAKEQEQQRIKGDDNER